MKLNLKVKFSLYIGAMIAFILLIVGLIVVGLRVQEIETDLVQRNQIISSNVAGQLSEYLGDFYYLQFDTFKQLINNLIATYPDIHRIKIINPEGRILFDTVELMQGKYTGTNERIVTDQELLKRIDGLKVSYDFTADKGERFLRIVAPYIDKYDTHRTSVEFTFSLGKIREATQRGVILFVVLFGVFIVIGIGLTVVVVTRTTKPISRLKQGAEQVRQGNLDYRVEVKTRDELEDLADSFNQMAQDIKKSRAEIEEYNRTLEQQVADRTKELQVKVTDLERMEKIAVGRELKMIELKKELEAAKKKMTVNIKPGPLKLT